jgi:tRNA pseudouridine55 synthase
MSEGRIILINKPYDWTSFDVVKYIKKGLRNEKVGHAGTLDPLATGLLVLCTGKMTKRISEIQDSEKEYTGTFTLGATTTSYDLETEVSEGKEIGHLTDEVIRETAKKFVGEITQYPPPHSAVKINGQRAYSLARKGEVFELKSKMVTVKAFEITKIVLRPQSSVYSPEATPDCRVPTADCRLLPQVSFRIVCGKGTYIRSLANDFGKALGCGAFLSALCRTRIGNNLLSDAVEPHDFMGYSSGKENITAA